MDKVALVLNGEKNTFMNRIKTADAIIAVDGGIKHLIKDGIKADLFIGDMDSIGRKELFYIKTHKIQVLKYPRDKDKTDFELAIDYLIENKFNGDLEIYSALGKREDHSYNILHSCESFASLFKSVTLYSYRQVLRFIGEGDNLTINNNSLKNVSILILSEDANISLRGFKWNLKNKTVKRTSSLPISNKILDKKASVNINKGKAFIYLNK